MEEKKVSPLYRLIYALVRLFSPKYRLLGTENLPDGPCVIVGNHSQMYGPIAGEMYTPGPHYVWCAGEMMHRGEVADYAYRDFWSGKPPAVRWLYRLFSYLIVPLSLLIFNSAHTVSVYRDQRLLTTFRQSAALLEQGNRLVIFPECYTPYNNIVHDFQSHFIDLGRLYYRRTGQRLAFVPMYLAPRLGTLSYGPPIRFDPQANMDDERRRIAHALMEGVTALALAQPEHTVVPYPNIPKRQYPKNIPLEVAHHDESTAL